MFSIWARNRAKLDIFSGSGRTAFPFMNLTELREVAWISDAFTAQPPRGVAVIFHGLGAPPLLEAPREDEQNWINDGYLVVFPYYGPWSWMNRQSRALVDGIVEAVFRLFSLPPDLPVLAVGGSMGGFSALLYTRYAARSVAGCFANSPVCDLGAHFRERPDLPRTIRHAFLGYPESLEELLIEHSPLHQAGALPDIPYFIVHAEGDPAVSKVFHSDPLVAAMRARGLDVTYCEVPGDQHCPPLSPENRRARIDFLRRTDHKDGENILTV